jgi:predicted 3-demethylubiquinone-9 3-methyltransferase (glyoxalase superfamily)
MKSRITANLWFNNSAKEAVDYYLSIFSDGKIINIDYYTEVGEEITGHKKGDIVTIEFEIMKTRFIAINAGPEFVFNPSVSFLIECDSQQEIDYYWNKLSSDPQFEQCGCLKDKYGVAWQISPTKLNAMLKKGTPEQRKRVTKAYMEMKKFNIKELENAYNMDS